MKLNNFSAGPSKIPIEVLSTIAEDINNYNAKEIKKLAGLRSNEKVDLIVGGPPCQAFSTAGKRLSINENRGVVFYKFW